VILQQEGIITPSKMIHSENLSPANRPVAEAEIIPLEEIERQHILKTFEQLSGNYTQTARALKIGLSTLKRKIKHYQLSN
jgi:DNA-binding NtrC family response regulator